jgi:hypothetical protein
MNTERMEQLERFLDSSLSAEEMGRFCRDVRGDAELRAALVSSLRLAGLAHAARDAEAWTAELARVTSMLVANDDPQNSFESRVMARCEAAGVAHGRRPPARRRIFFWVPLAAAAALVIAVGGYWMIPAAPVVQVAEVRGQVVGGRWQVGGGQAGVTESPSHPVTESKATSHKPLRAGDVLRPGDGVEVGADGCAKLAYPDGTQIDLHGSTRLRVTLGTGRDKDAKRLALDDGLLICSVAPQKKPFLLETAHGVAEVVGTRFSLGENAAQTTLAVKEGRVDLHQKDQRLEVSAGETAVADAAGLRQLSPEDAWLRELLARAETGPWDVVNFGTGVYSNDVWRMDARGGPAERRIWNTPIEPDRAGLLSFRDGKRWARGVVTGRMLILPDGRSPAELAGVEMATNIQWHAYRFRVPGASADSQKSRKAGVSLSCGPARRESSLLRGVVADEKLDGVWCRYAVYFDTETPDGLCAISAVWLEGVAPPSGSDWMSERDKGIGSDKVEIGLMAEGVLMEAQGLKFVPLGPDMPLPPKGLLDRK